MKSMPDISAAIRTTGFLSRKGFPENFIQSREMKMLYQIGISFGFSDKESSTLAQNILSKYIEHKTYRHTADRLQIARQMVRKCIFLISSNLCADTAYLKIGLQMHYTRYHSVPYYYSSLPFTCQTVYILSKIIKFNDAEVADILNITPVQMKERLSRAADILKAVS